MPLLPRMCARSSSSHCAGLRLGMGKHASGSQWAFVVRLGVLHRLLLDIAKCFIDGPSDVHSFARIIWQCRLPFHAFKNLSIASEARTRWLTQRKVCLFGAGFCFSAASHTIRTLYLYRLGCIQGILAFPSWMEISGEGCFDAYFHSATNRNVEPGRTTNETVLHLLASTLLFVDGYRVL